MEWKYDAEELFDLYLAPNLLLNDGVNIRATSSITKKLPFISELMKSKFKEGIIIKNNNKDIDLKIPLIKLDVSSDFIKLIETPYMFEGGDVGLYQDYLMAKGYDYSLFPSEIFDLERVDLKTYFDKYDSEIFDIYDKYLFNEDRNHFILQMITAINGEYLESNIQYRGQINRFILNFDLGTSFKNILLALNTLDFSDNIVDKFISNIIIKKLDTSRFKRRLFLNIINSTKNLLSFGLIKKEMLKIVYKNLNKEQYNLENILSKYYPVISKLEPDITNFFFNITHIKDLINDRSLVKKILNIYNKIDIIARTKMSYLDQNNIILGITDTVIKYIPWEEFKQKSDFDISYSFYSILNKNIDYLELDKTEKFDLKIKALILKLFGVLSSEDDWTKSLVDSFKFRKEYSDAEELNILKDKMRILLKDGIIKLAVLKGVKYSEIQKIINFFEFQNI